MGALAFAALSDLARLPLLNGIFSLIGTAKTLFDTVSVSVLPTVVAGEDLRKTNGHLYAGQIVANNVAGPPLGGLLFASAAALPFLRDADTFAAAVTLIFTPRGRFRTRATQTPVEASPTTMRTEIAEGLSWLWRHRLLRALVLTIGVMSLTFGAAVAVWVFLYVQERLGLSPLGYGALAAAIPVGGVLRGLVAECVAGLLGTGTTLLAGLLVEVATHMVLVSTLSPLLAGTALAVFGFHALVWGTLNASLCQELVPDDFMGRVTIIYLLFDGLIAGGRGLPAFFWLAVISVVAWVAAMWRALGDRAIERALRRGEHSMSGIGSSLPTIKTTNICSGYGWV